MNDILQVSLCFIHLFESLLSISGMPSTFIRSEHKAMNRAFLLQSFMGIGAGHQSYKVFWKGILLIVNSLWEDNSALKQDPQSQLLCLSCGPLEPRAEGFILGGFPAFLAAMTSAAFPAPKGRNRQIA